jgi:hypothetical protein
LYNTNITSIKIGNTDALIKNQIGPASLPAFSDFLRSNEVISILNLQNCYLGDNGMKYLASAMVSCPIFCLDLSKNKITSVGMKALSMHLPKIPVQHLNL